MFESDWEEVVNNIRKSDEFAKMSRVTIQVLGTGKVKRGIIEQGRCKYCNSLHNQSRISNCPAF